MEHDDVRHVLAKRFDEPREMVAPLREDHDGASFVEQFTSVSDDELEPLRDHGRRIAGALLVFIDAETPEERRAAMLKAVGAATEYGKIAARGSGQIRETVEAFLRFRMLFLGELAQVARRRGLDTSEATSLLVTATQAIDQLLVALMNGHETELAKKALVGGRS